MERLLTQNDSLDIVEVVDVLGQEQILQELLPATPFGRPQSYRSTPWEIVNSLLDSVDTITHGRAGLLQRLSSFVIIGGMAAIVNLVVFYVVFYHIPLPVSTSVHNAIASVLAAEISIMANFIPNDHFTFRYLPGRNRSWLARCARFQMTSIGGSILTFLIEFGLSSAAHFPAIIAQAAALILVLFYNFSFHHLFTYRHVKA
ncbi:MAG: hypothetical protein NVS4B1_15280 [Ktedonobacteraceae bacterium]